MKDIPFPKEYGSWGILLTSCVIGIFIQGQVTGRTFVSLAGIALLFMTKAPIGIFVRRRKITFFLFTLVYGVAGILLLLPVVLDFSMRDTFFLLTIPLMTVGVYVVSAYLHKERASVVELFAMTTLTLPVLFFYLQGSGRPGIGIVLLWVSTFLYFSASIFRVKMLLYKKTAYRIANILYLTFVFIVVSIMIYLQFIPLLSAAAFTPLLENITDTFRHARRHNLKLVGITELVKGTAFAVIIIMAERHMM